ncbi:MAG: hypothetical protein IJ193_09325 [Bacilli bacterium]|nr:hypothetical protein [Bacilli bacterium]
MLRICLGIAVIIVGFIYPLHIELYLIIGGLLIASGLFDGGLEDINRKYSKIIPKSKKTKVKQEALEWKNRLENNPESKKLIEKFAKKIVEKNVTFTTIREEAIDFGDKRLNFIDIDMKNLNEIGCKVMAMEIKKALMEQHRVPSTIRRLTTKVSRKEVFDGYEIKKEMILYTKEEGTKDW